MKTNENRQTKQIETKTKTRPHSYCFQLKNRKGSKQSELKQAQIQIKQYQRLWLFCCKTGNEKRGAGDKCQEWHQKVGIYVLLNGEPKMNSNNNTERKPRPDFYKAQDGRHKKCHNHMKLMLCKSEMYYLVL